MTENVTYCDKHVSSRKYIFLWCIDGLVRPSFNINDIKTSKGIGLLKLAPEERRFLCKVHLTRFR